MHTVILSRVPPQHKYQSLSYVDLSRSSFSANVLSYCNSFALSLLEVLSSVKLVGHI